MERVKLYLSIAIGFFSTLFGGFDIGFVTLLLLMLIDYISGVILAGVFKRSPKTQNGGLNSNVGFIGITKKVIILLIVVIAVMLDKFLETSFIRNCVIAFYCMNELLSIIENAGEMGIPIPNVITKAVDILNNRSDKE